MTDLVFWGGTGQARVLREAVESAGHRLIAIFDRREIASPFADVPIAIGEEAFERWAAAQPGLGALRACVAIGGGRGQERLATQDWLALRGVAPMTVVHRTAFVATDAVIGAGCQILALAAVCANARLGASVIINTAASIDHCSVIGPGSHLGPGARLAGEVELGANVFVGTGAIVLPRIRVGAGATIGAGAVVTKDVAAGAVVVGNPARPSNSSG